jgi:hypothetical protein
MLLEARRTFFGFMLYTVAIAAVLAALGACGVIALKATPQLLPPQKRQQSALDIQIEGSRSIREALAKPLPSPTPLAPITAKRANPVPFQVTSTMHPKHKSRPNPSQALNAMAMETVQGPSILYPEYDRTAPR